MKNKEFILTEEQLKYSNELALNSIVHEMIKEFEKNKSTYLEEKYSKMDDLAKKVLSAIASGNLRSEYVRYIYDKFISDVEDL